MSGHTTGSKRLPLLVLSLALCAAPARAQVAGHVIEAHGGIGFVQYDSLPLVPGAHLRVRLAGRGHEAQPAVPAG